MLQLMAGLLLQILETVDGDTPASAATSFNVTDMFWNLLSEYNRISLLLNLCIVIAVVFTCTINKIPSIDTFLKHLILNPVMVIFYWKLSFLVSNNSILLKLGKYSFYIFLFHEPIIVRGISELINSTVVYSSFAYVFMVTGLSIIVTLLFVKIYLYGKSKRVIIWIKKATNSVN